MNKIPYSEVESLIAHGESQRLEFKGDIEFDGHSKNFLCSEIAAMANAGDGRILIGVMDDGSIVGVSPEAAKTLQEVGWLEKLVRERMTPEPVVDLARCDLEDGRAIFAIRVLPPWHRSPPDYAPVILIKDVQTADGRLRYGKGTVLFRDHDACRVVMEHRQWDRLMQGVLMKFQEDRLGPILRALIQQGHIGESSIDRSAEIRRVLPKYEAEFEVLRASDPESARLDGEIALLGIEHLSYARLEELVENAYVQHRGWRFPFFHRQRLQHEESLVSRVDGRERDLPYHEFWMFSPNGWFASSALYSIDREPRIGGRTMPPPGPNRPIDPTTVCWHVFEFVEFVRNLASDAGVKRVWARFNFANVLNRPLANLQATSASMMGPMHVREYRCNVKNIALQQEFDTLALEIEWRDIAADWGRRVLSAFGFEVQVAVVRDVQDALTQLRMAGTRPVR